MTTDFDRQYVTEEILAGLRLNEHTKSRAATMAVLGLIWLVDSIKHAGDPEYSRVDFWIGLAFLVFGILPLNRQHALIFLTDGIIACGCCLYLLSATLLDMNYWSGPFHLDWVLTGLSAVAAFWCFRWYAGVRKAEGSKMGVVVAVAWLGVSAALIWADWEYSDMYSYHLRTGQGAFGSGDRQRAMDEFTKAIRTNPRHYRGYLLRGLMRFHDDDPSAAMADLTVAVDLNPQSSDAWYYRGMCRQRLKDFGGAVSDYTAALARDPTYADAYGSRGLLLLAEGKIDAAQRDFEQSWKLRPELKTQWEKALATRAAKVQRK